MNSLRLTAAAAVLSAIGVQAIAQETSELTAAERAEQFVQSISSTSGVSLPSQDLLEIALESHFAGATACEISDGFDISSTLVQRRVVNIRNLLDEADQAVVTAGFPNFRPLEDEMHNLIRGEDNGFIRDIERAKLEIINSNPDFSDYRIQETLYRSAVNEWLSDNHSVTTEHLYEELRSLAAVLAVTASTETRESRSVQVAALGCAVENDTPTTNAGPAVLRSVLGIISPS